MPLPFPGILDMLLPTGDRLVGFVSGASIPGLEADETALLTSKDGSHWEAVSGPLDGVAVTAVARDERSAWAFGQTLGPSGREHQVWTSRDGLDWRRLDGVEGLDIGRGWVREVAVHTGVLVALVQMHRDEEFGELVLMRSEGGRRWDRVASRRGPSYGIRSLAAGPTGFVVTFVAEVGGVRQEAEAWHSRDGRSWTRHPLAASSNAFNVLDLIGGPSGYLAVGVIGPQRVHDGLAAVWRSADGAAWSGGIVDDGSATSSSAMDEIVTVEDGYLALGRAGSGSAAVWASPDGERWWRVRDGPDGTAEGNLYAAVGWQGGVVVTGIPMEEEGPSSNAIAWTGPVSAAPPAYVKVVIAEDPRNSALARVRELEGSRCVREIHFDVGDEILDLDAKAARLGSWRGLLDAGDPNVLEIGDAYLGEVDEAAHAFAAHELHVSRANGSPAFMLATATAIRGVPAGSIAAFELVATRLRNERVAWVVRGDVTAPNAC